MKMQNIPEQHKKQSLDTCCGFAFWQQKRQFSQNFSSEDNLPFTVIFFEFGTKFVEISMNIILSERIQFLCPNKAIFFIQFFYPFFKALKRGFFETNEKCFKMLKSRKKKLKKSAWVIEKIFKSNISQFEPNSVKKMVDYTLIFPLPLVQRMTQKSTLSLSFIFQRISLSTF